jgi:hypothetical protein
MFMPKTATPEIIARAVAGFMSMEVSEKQYFLLS